MIKPSVSTEWATQDTSAGPSGNPNKLPLEQGIKDFGQSEGMPIPRQDINYILNAFHIWKEYLEATTDAILKFRNVDNTSLPPDTKIKVRESILVDTSSGNVTVQLPEQADILASSVGETFTVKHKGDGTGVCTLSNTDMVILGKGGYNSTSGEDIVLSSGSQITLIVISTTTLEVQ